MRRAGDRREKQWSDIASDFVLVESWLSGNSGHCQVSSLCLLMEAELHGFRHSESFAY